MGPDPKPPGLLGVAHKSDWPAVPAANRGWSGSLALPVNIADEHTGRPVKRKPGQLIWPRYLSVRHQGFQFVVTAPIYSCATV